LKPAPKAIVIVSFLRKFFLPFGTVSLKYLALKRILLLLALILPHCIQAQQTHHEIGITVGASNYWGDLQPKFFANYGYHPMGGIVYKYFMGPHVGVRLGASYTSLSAADSLSNIPVSKQRNLSFATHLFEFHGALEFNFFPVEILKRKASPFLFGGISVFYFNPFAEDNNGNKIYLRPLSTEGQGLPMYPDRKQYSLVNMAFPFGGGMKFFIGQKLMLTGEVGFRYTNTDYLDDVSKSYVNLDTLQAYKGHVSKDMSYRGKDNVNPNYGYQRGDSKSNDWYWFANITATVYFRAFGNPRVYLKTKCPGFFRQ
jgi:hypothetical protein